MFIMAYSIVSILHCVKSNGHWVYSQHSQKKRLQDFLAGCINPATLSEYFHYQVIWKIFWNVLRASCTTLSASHLPHNNELITHVTGSVYASASAFVPLTYSVVHLHLWIQWRLGSSVSIVAMDWTTWVWSPAKAKEFSSTFCIQTSSGAHPDSYPMGCWGGSFP
jgi:hypothetical protein